MNGRVNYNKLPATKEGEAAIVAPKRTLSEAGRISIGVKASNGTREYPQSVDYFVVRSQFASRVTGLYGDKPKELPIMFYSDDFNEVCNERLEIRDQAGRLFGYGDGETFSIFSPKINAYVEVTTAQRPDVMGKTQEFLQQGISDPKKRELIKWAPVLTVRFAIKDIPVLGYWQFSTKAVKTTIPNLRDTFDQCLQTFGTVRYFPFTMTVKKVKSNKPGDTRQYPVVDIVPQISIETGLKLSEYLQQNPDFNQAKLALMSAEELNQNTSNGRLLLGGGERL